MDGAGPPPGGAKPRPRPRPSARPRNAASGSGWAPPPPQARADVEQAAGVLNEYASMSAEINDLLQGTRRRAGLCTPLF